MCLGCSFNHVFPLLLCELEGRLHFNVVLGGFEELSSEVDTYLIFSDYSFKIHLLLLNILEILGSYFLILSEGS